MSPALWCSRSPCLWPTLPLFLGDARQNTLFEMERGRNLFWRQTQHRGDFPRLPQRALALVAMFQVAFYLGGSLIFKDSQSIGVNLVLDVLLCLVRCISHTSIRLNALCQQELLEPLHPDANAALDRTKWVA